MKEEKNTVQVETTVVKEEKSEPPSKRVKTGN